VGGKRAGPGGEEGDQEEELIAIPQLELPCGGLIGREHMAGVVGEESPHDGIDLGCGIRHGTDGLGRDQGPGTAE
jgi:hypothetical protein